MMRPPTSVGGVLTDGSQSQLHGRVTGVGYRTQAQKDAQLRQMVVPFTSMQLHRPTSRQQQQSQQSHTQSADRTPVNSARGTTSNAPAGTARPKTASARSAAAPPSTSSRPVTSGSRKKSSRPTTASSAMSTASVEGGRQATPVQVVRTGAPNWVHPPERPNAPSQMDAAARAALHAVDPMRVRKPQKPVNRLYGKPALNSPRDGDVAAEVMVERHARPLVVHPPNRHEAPVVKFVPIGHVVGVRPTPPQNDTQRHHNNESEQDEDAARFAFVHAATPGLKPERHVHFTPAQPLNQAAESARPPVQDPSAAAFQSFQQMQAEFEPHSLFSQVDSQVEQFDPHSNNESTQLDTSPPSALSTPHSHHTAPQPYSTAFQPQTDAAQTTSTRREHDRTNGASNSHSHLTQPATEPGRAAATSPQQTANPLTSPSPARGRPPEPASTQVIQPVPSVVIATNPAPSDSVPLTPSRARSPPAAESAPLDPVDERRKLEAHHEKQMKSYLSPVSRSSFSSVRGIGTPTHKASPHFTPNPYVQQVNNSDPEQIASGTRLFYEPVQSRPADLPRVDPRAGMPPPVPVSLYPTTESDPMRSLAASLRRPRFKYAPASATTEQGAGDMFSPQKSDAEPIGANDPTDDPHVWLQREIDDRARAREKLAREHQDRWSQKWSRVREQPLHPAQRLAARVGIQTPNTVAAQENADPRTASGVDATDRATSAPPPANATRAAPSPRPFLEQALSHTRFASTPVATHSGVRATSTRNDSNHTPPTRQTPHDSTVATAIAPSSSHSPSTTSTAAVTVTPSVRRIVVGSGNQTKVGAVRAVVDQVFGSLHSESFLTQSGRAVPSAARTNKVVGVEVDSGVSAQPLSGSETKTGALTRARLALQSDPAAEFGVGIEGGIELIDGTWYESGWVAVIDRTGKIGTATSARFEIAESIARELLSGATELSVIVDRLSGQTGVRSKQGFMGVITNNLLQRAECYQQGVIFAFAPFISSPVYW